VRQPDVDPHGASDTPARRRRRRLPWIAAGVVLAGLVLFVWLHDRQAAHWENAQYGISLDFQNRFRNLSSGEDPGSYPEGILVGAAFVVRGNPGWDRREDYFNGFVVLVEEPPAEFKGMTAGQLAAEVDWERSAGAGVDSQRTEETTVGGRASVTAATDFEFDGVVWRERWWLVPVHDLWYQVYVRARLSDWDKEGPSLTEAALSLRISGEGG
jgi:hypothetical protein